MDREFFHDSKEEFASEKDGHIELRLRDPLTVHALRTVAAIKDTSFVDVICTAFAISMNIQNDMDEFGEEYIRCTEFGDRCIKPIEGESFAEDFLELNQEDMQKSEEVFRFQQSTITLFDVPAFRFDLSNEEVFNRYVSTGLRVLYDIDTIDLEARYLVKKPDGSETVLEKLEFPDGTVVRFT